MTDTFVSAAVCPHESCVWRKKNRFIPQNCGCSCNEKNWWFL